MTVGVVVMVGVVEVGVGVVVAVVVVEGSCGHKSHSNYACTNRACIARGYT